MSPSRRFLEARFHRVDTPIAMPSLCPQTDQGRYAPRSAAQRGEPAVPWTSPRPAGTRATPVAAAPPCATGTWWHPPQPGLAAQKPQYCRQPSLHSMITTCAHRNGRPEPTDLCGPADLTTAAEMRAYSAGRVHALIVVETMHQLRIVS